MKNNAVKFAIVIRRSSIAILIDAFLVANAYLLTMLVFVYEDVSRSYYREFLIFIPIAILVHCWLNNRVGLYRLVNRYVGLREATAAAKAAAATVAILILISLTLMSVFEHHAGYRSLVLIPIGGMMAMIFSFGVRLYPKLLSMRSSDGASTQANVLIVGAGDASEQIVHSIRKDPHPTMKVVALVDDDPRMKGLQIHGISIEGSTAEVGDVVAQKGIDEILIAIPSATCEQFQRIWKICAGTGLPVKTLGSLQNLSNGKVGVRQIRDIQFEDVLGRPSAQTDYAQIRKFIRGKTVMVTGAGGSIGSELVTQISHNDPLAIILVDQDETALYHIHEELDRQHFLNHEIYVADVKSERKMTSIFARTRPEIVFHAAAYKHVPLMEMHPDMSVLNNVQGTLNVATIAGDFGVQSFVNISSDKAVKPVNIMGATKRLCERLVAELDEINPDTRYCSVRFGNVLGSRGSVIPIFRQQILSGGPVTITDPQMTRYFMTISEAVDLVLQAAAFQDSNAVYVLDMGEPVKIMDLARQMIDFYKPEEPVEIVFTGLRPGEKLHEHLFDVNETPTASRHQMIYRVDVSGWNGFKMLSLLPLLFEKARAEDKGAIRGLLGDWIPTFRSFDADRVGQMAAGEDESYVDAALMTTDGGMKYQWPNMDGGNSRKSPVRSNK